jgi:hypothetical protein
MDADLDMANRTSQAIHINLKHKDLTDKIFTLSSRSFTHS